MIIGYQRNTYKIRQKHKFNISRWISDQRISEANLNKNEFIFMFKRLRNSSPACLDNNDSIDATYRRDNSIPRDERSRSVTLDNAEISAEVRLYKWANWPVERPWVWFINSNIDIVEAVVSDTLNILRKSKYGRDLWMKMTFSRKFWITGSVVSYMTSSSALLDLRGLFWETALDTFLRMWLTKKNGDRW